MDKIKILQFPIASSRGGITQYVLNNWKFIDRKRFYFDFATMSKALPMKEELESQGSRVFSISCYAEENMRQFEEEFKKILSGGYDAVHLHTKQWKSFCVEQIAKECGIKKIIIHAHSTGIDTQDKEKYEEEILRHYQLRDQVSAELGTDFLACSWPAAEFLYGNHISPGDIKIMRNAIDVSKFTYNRELRKRVRKELNLKDNFVIGHVGRFTYSKNHEFLIDVFKAVAAVCERARLVLAGSGELEPYIKKKVQEYNLGDKVVFLGHCSKTDELFQAMDIFALPSRFEGLPITSVEAQTSGLKCIVSDSVSEEARISDNIIQLPLHMETWMNQILRFQDGYEREDMYCEITERGYNIKNEILKLEELYTYAVPAAPLNGTGGGVYRVNTHFPA